MRRRRIETFVETHERITVYQPGLANSQLCSECFSETRMVAPDLAAVVCRISTRAIYSLAEKEKIHFVETAEGLLLVCLPSLFVATENDGRAANWPC